MKIITIVGARPQFIKAAAVSRAFANYNNQIKTKIEEKIIHTGQHYDYNMSDVFLQELALPKPCFWLNVGSSSHGSQTGAMLKLIEEILLTEKPNVVLVYGDTNSTLAGALAAAKLHIPIAHVEAGLRSFNKKMPEEINRVLCDHVSTMLYCPTQTAINNLKNEGIAEGVKFVGDVMYDNLLYYTKISEAQSKVIESLDLSNQPYILATIHRAENTDYREQLNLIIKSLIIASEIVGKTVLALHPRTKKKLLDYDIKIPEDLIKIIEPASYLDLLSLLANASLVITDSGGLQKEAYFSKVPCITMRDETEWVETIECDANRLVNASSLRIAELISRFKTGTIKPNYTGNFFGDGNAASLIVDNLIKNL